MFGDQARLIALNRTDEVPDQRRTRGAECAYGEQLGDTLLRVVLPEYALAAKRRLRDVFGAKRLGNRDQLNVLRTAASSTRGDLDARPEVREAAFDCAHALRAFVCGRRTVTTVRQGSAELCDKARRRCATTFCAGRTLPIDRRLPICQAKPNGHKICLLGESANRSKSAALT